MSSSVNDSRTSFSYGEEQSSFDENDDRLSAVLNYSSSSEEDEENNDKDLKVSTLNELSKSESYSTFGDHQETLSSTTADDSFAATTTDGNKDNTEQLHQEQRRKRFWFVIVLTVFLVAVALLTFMGIRIKRNNSKRRQNLKKSQVLAADEKPRKLPDPVHATTEAPTSSMTPTVYQLLAEKVENQDELLDSSTSRGKAFEAINDEGLSDPFQIIQKFALLTLYYSTSPEFWKHDKGWKNNLKDPCLWYGVDTCRHKNGMNHVTNLGLESNNLIGKLPPEICWLDQLESLILSSNGFSGSLPSCIATDLVKLTLLDVDENLFSGHLPQGLFSNSRSLEGIIVSNNFFDGTLDKAVKITGNSNRNGNGSDSMMMDYEREPFSIIRTVSLHNNYFSGKLPSEFEDFPILDYLTLHGNSFDVDYESLCDSISADSVVTTTCADHGDCTCCTECY